MKGIDSLMGGTVGIVVFGTGAGYWNSDPWAFPVEVELVVTWSGVARGFLAGQSAKLWPPLPQ